MNKVQFNITNAEIKKLSPEQLTEEQIESVLTIVENDQVLWDNIEESIKDAIRKILLR